MWSALGPYPTEVARDWIWVIIEPIPISESHKELQGVQRSSKGPLIFSPPWATARAFMVP